MRGVWNWIVTRTADYGLPKQIELIDIVQILLIAFFVYHLIRWLQNEAGRKNREFIDGNRLSLAQVAVDADLFRLMLASGSMNVTPGQHLCRCIQKHRPDLLETALSANRDEDLFYPDLQDDTPFPDKNGTPSARQWDAPEIRALAGILSEVCPGIATEWVSVLKRGIPSRRNGSRSGLYPDVPRAPQENSG